MREKRKLDAGVGRVTSASLLRNSPDIYIHLNIMNRDIRVRHEFMRMIQSRHLSSRTVASSYVKQSVQSMYVLCI